MITKNHVVRGYYVLIGCLTFFIDIVGLVFYIMLMVRVFQKGAEWLVSLWIILGLMAMLTILPVLACLFIEKGATKDKHHIDCCNH